MVTEDVSRTVERFLAASGRIRQGLAIQRERVESAYNNAPRTTAGGTLEWIEVTGIKGNDLDYYAYEVGRLHDLVEEMLKSFKRPAKLVTALEEFEAAVPKFKQFRNPSTHMGDDRLDDVITSFAAIRLLANGDADYLVDPRYQQHDAAIELLDFVHKFLLEQVHAND